MILSGFLSVYIFITRWSCIFVKVLNLRCVNKDIVILTTWSTCIYFFNCYLAAPGPNSGHYRGDSFNHPMLITAFYIFDPRVIGSLVAERLVRIVPATFRFWLQRLNPLGHIRIWIIYIKILKKNVVAHVFLKVKYRLSTNLELAILCDQELNWKFAPSLWGLKTCIT